MLVLPHHFQAADADFRDQLRLLSDWLRPGSYGVMELEVLEECLGDYDLRVTRLVCRFKDGSVVSVPAAASLPIANVRTLSQQHHLLYVHAVLPRLAAGRSNFAAARSQAEPEHRYISLSQHIEDMGSESNSREIDFLEYNIQLIVQPSLQAPSGFESIPICRLRRSTRPGAVPELDPTYIPPLLNCQATRVMQQDLLMVICSQLGAFIKVQAGVITSRGGWTDAGSPEHLRTILLLQAANSSYPLLLSLLNARVLHPFQMYTELCRTIGQLSIARPDWEPPRLPDYDHDDLYRVFRTLQQELESIYHSDGSAGGVQRVPFVGVGSWLEISCSAAWFSGGYEFFIGIQSEMEPEEVDRMFASGHLDWKMGSSHRIAQIFQNAEAGLQLDRHAALPMALPRLVGMKYYRIDNRGEYWASVAETQLLAIRINERSVRGGLSGKTAISVIDPGGEERQISLSLFVVRQGAS
jgi:type VI secretion system protein ImpJ